MTWTRIPSRRQRVIATVSCVTALGLLAACGDSGDDDSADVASLGTTAPDGGADTNDSGGGDGAAAADDEGETDPQQAMLDYSECMRDHGIDMPDPQFEEGGGGFIVNGGPGSEDEGGPSFDPESEEFQAADEECSPILDDAVSQIEIDPEQEAEMREQMLAFAECMREHGIDMPDPTFDDNGRVTARVGSEDGSVPMDQDAMQEAAQACQEEVGGPMVFGGGPGTDTDSGN
jgi:hypothetical protein